MCFKVEEDDRMNCPNRQLAMCPPAVALTDDRFVEVVCAAPCGSAACGKHLAIPIGNVMKRRQLTNLGVCAFDQCRARVVLPSAKGGNVPPPISGK